MAQPDTTPDQDASRGTCGHNFSTHRHGVAEFEKLAQRAWSPSRWREKDPRRKGEVAQLRHYRWCARGDSARMASIEDRLARKFRRHRQQEREQQRALAALTPYGEWAIPAYIVECESHGDWGAYNPSGAAGPYQIMPEWGRPWPIDSGGDKVAHHRLAARIYAGGAGASNWVCA